MTRMGPIQILLVLKCVAWIGTAEPDPVYQKEKEKRWHWQSMLKMGCNSLRRSLPNAQIGRRKDSLGMFSKAHVPDGRQTLRNNSTLLLVDTIVSFLCFYYVFLSATHLSKDSVLIKVAGI